MTDTNPPQERETAHQDTDQKIAHPAGLWWVLGSAICDQRNAEQISSETSSFLNQVEPDANRRAGLWLLSRQIGSDYDSEAEGARLAGEWVRAMCKPPRPSADSKDSGQGPGRTLSSNSRAPS
jgi:hypothetical protein